MNTKEILTIIALAALGLCLLCSLAKAAMKKGDKGKKHCDKACGAFVFLAIILLAVSQLLGEGTEKYGQGCQLMSMKGKNGLCHVSGGQCGDGGLPCPPNNGTCDHCDADECPATCCKYMGMTPGGKNIYKQQVENNAGIVTVAAETHGRRNVIPNNKYHYTAKLKFNNS